MNKIKRVLNVLLGCALMAAFILAVVFALSLAWAIVAVWSVGGATAMLGLLCFMIGTQLGRRTESA